MERIYKPIKYKNYIERFKTEFFPPVIIVAILSLISYKSIDLYSILSVIIGYIIIWGIFTHYIVKNSINQIIIDEGNIFLKGTNINKEWQDSNKIENTSVKIKCQGYGSRNVEYYLKLYFSEKTYRINKRKEWDYVDLIKVYYHIAEHGIDEENSILLEKMEMKSKGYSPYEITFNKKRKSD